METNLIPEFNFETPRAYLWLLERGIVDFKPFSGLQPWHYLDRDKVFVVNDRWPNGPSKEKLLAYAQRQDNDDIACFELIDNKVNAILIVHGWTSNGYENTARFDTFWDWLKAVIDDIAEMVDLNE